MINKPLSSSSTSLTVLSLIIKYCGDNDTSIRKFACFAVGNAAFHSSELYEVIIISNIIFILIIIIITIHTQSLVESVEVLRDALSDGDEKTRANAAGALGNLIRNGGKLAPTMAESLVPETLMQVVLDDKEVSPQRISLFSLGTMSVYASCRQSILNATNPSINELFRKLKEGDKRNDETIQKYITRLKQKMNTSTQV